MGLSLLVAMPFRLDPSDSKCVQVEKAGTWEELTCHPTTAAATKHLAALNINMEEATKGMELQGEFQKLDEEQQLVFGWASVASQIVDGQPMVLVDKQGDVLDLPSLEKAVYDYVLKSRSADEMHRVDDVGTLVESILFTPEKIEKMGIPEGIVPLGLWVGFKITDGEVWKKIKDGTYSMFSIRGQGDREDLPDA